MTPRVFLPLGLLAVCLLLVGSASAYLAGYGYYQDVTLNNTGSNLTNYQMMFVVNTSSGTSSGTTIYLNSHSEADLDDLRFTSTSDTVYDYWIESTSNPYNVWVEVPSILAGNSTMRVQYGNAAASAVSNGTNTFEFFDDFNSGTLDTTTKWEVVSSQSYSIASGILTVSGVGDANDYIKSKTATFGIGYAMRSRSRWDNKLGSSYFGFYNFMNDGAAWWDTAGYAAYAQNAGSGTCSGTPVAGSTFYIYETQRISSSSTKFYRDTNLILDVTSSAYITTADRMVLLRQYGSGYSQAHDWILVRKIVATLPTAPSWSGESPTSAAPVAAFSGTPTSGATPLTVAFTDASTNTPTSWAWSWDDGTANGTTQNPSHQFTTAGTYTITLTATNADGSDTEEKVDYITVCDTPVAAFSANVTSGTIPLYVAFTDATTGSPASWAWSFDDGGANSTAQNPTRTFSATGTYTITLTATNCGGSDGETKVDYIHAYELTAFPGCAAPPNDLDADGYYEDINGNGRIDWADLIVFFTHLAWAQANQPPAFFDFANDGGTITYADVTALYPIIAGGT